MPGILGRKIGMARIVSEDGKVIPVTLVKVTPNTIIQVKTVEVDGYSAIKIACEPYKNSTPNKKYKAQREFRLEPAKGYEKGQSLELSLFEGVKTVSVQGTSKGKGFAGVIKRHNFNCGPMSHGSDHHREPGSIGTCKPNRVKKGTKLPGRMGHKKITLKKIPVIKLDNENNLLVLKGSLPGAINGLVKVTVEK